MTPEETEAAAVAANETDLAAWHDFFDLAVPLSIELGRTKLTVREILSMEAHSIVQLSRSSGEGVDLLADNQPLARGEILMVEDRTGIRINEVVIRED